MLHGEKKTGERGEKAERIEHNAKVYIPASLYEGRGKGRGVKVEEGKIRRSANFAPPHPGPLPRSGGEGEAERA